MALAQGETWNSGDTIPNQENWVASPNSGVRTVGNFGKSAPLPEFRHSSYRQFWDAPEWLNGPRLRFREKKQVPAAFYSLRYGVLFLTPTLDRRYIAAI
jgi:hypothetical protein